MSDPRFDSLSTGERNVLRLAADHANGEIASLLGLSPETIKTQLARARLKLGGMPRGAASRAFRRWEACHPSQVNPDRVMGGADRSEASIDPSPRLVHPAGQGVNVVREARAEFEGFPSSTSDHERERRVELDFDGRTRLLLWTILISFVVLLCMLAIAGSLQQLVLPHIANR